jgi:hypothetical protein
MNNLKGSLFNSNKCYNKFNKEILNKQGILIRVETLINLINKNLNNHNGKHKVCREDSQIHTKHLQICNKEANRLK